MQDQGHQATGYQANGPQGRTWATPGPRQGRTGGGASRQTQGRENRLNKYRLMCNKCKKWGPLHTPGRAGLIASTSRFLLNEFGLRGFVCGGGGPAEVSSHRFFWYFLGIFIRFSLMNKAKFWAVYIAFLITIFILISIFAGG